MTDASVSPPAPLPWIPRSIWFLSLGTVLLLFGCSSLRHGLFRSTAFDLAWFDQGIYLISQGQPPIVSFSGFHILGDHAAFIFYPLALLYRLYADVHWLFAVQAIALGGAAPLVWLLAIQGGLSRSLANTLTLVYLLSPVVFNVNLFDFHSDVIAIPGILGAVLAARSRRIIPFTAWILLILASKAVLSLTLIMVGVWLWCFEQRRICGAIAAGLSTAWFLFSTQVIFPYFTGGEHAAVGRYDYLGDSVLDIGLNLVKNPQIILGHLFQLSSLEYAVLLLIPYVWGLHYRNWVMLIPALPQFVLNLLSDADTQRDLVHQYSVPILPFLVLMVLAALTSDRTWLRRRQLMLGWAVVGFVALAKPGYFWSIYLNQLDTWQATRGAIAAVTTKGGVLTTSNIAPQLSQRSLIRQTLVGQAVEEVDRFDYVVLNGRHPGWGSDQATHQRILDYLVQSNTFEQRYERDEVVVFGRSTPVSTTAAPELGPT